MSVAWAMVFDESPPRIFVATDELVLTRLLALKVVARTDPRRLVEGQVTAIRDALLEERWGDAVAAWVIATGIGMDVYPDEALWSADALDEELVSLQVRLSPIFEDPAPPGG